MSIKENDIYVTRSSLPPFEEYIESIKPLWESRLLTNMGAFHRELEEKLADYLDVPQISLTVNGHSALELAIQAFNFTEGSEIITTPFTFISTTHAIVRNHLRPVFCDVKETDGTIDEAKLSALVTPKTVAILPVHVYGNICNVKEIDRVAKRYNLPVIYDAAHAFGEAYQGKGVGNFGDVSIFSFHATKVYNTIEGGAVVCKNPSMYEKIHDLKNFGIRGEELTVSVGTNAKLNEFCAVMGLLNLKHIGEAIADRRQRYQRYMDNLSSVRGLRILISENGITRNYGYLPVIVTKEHRLTRDALYQKLAERGFHARKYFYPLTADQACFKNAYARDKLDIARDLSDRVLVLPLYESLPYSVIDEICNVLANEG